MKALGPVEEASLVFDWCEYNGETYFAAINIEESEKRGKLIYVLAHCATAAMNDIFIKQRVWSKRFQPSQLGSWKRKEA